MIHPQLVETIRQEFLEGSAIAPDVFEAAVEIVPDLQFDLLTREVLGTPLYDALGWRYTRFTHSVRPTQIGACFKQETGEVWQAKVFGVESGRRSGRYFAPKGSGDRPYFPPIPSRVIEAIANCYGVSPPNDDESFYDWLLVNPQVPIVLTEGGKKSLSVLSAGDAAIALFGCLCGVDGETKLPKSEVLSQLYRNRTIYIALDRDTSPKAQRAVFKGISRLAKSVQICGGTPLILDWDVRDGKGIDDVLSGCDDPMARWQELKANALTFSRWRSRNEFQLTRQPNLEINADKLNNQNCPLELIPNKLIAIRSPHGTGKTTLVGEWVKRQTNQGTPAIALTHYRSLERELSNKFGLPRRSDSTPEKIFGMVTCIDSLRDKINGFNADDWRDAEQPIVVIEEATQLLNHLLFGVGTDVEKYRPEILHQLGSLLKMASKVVLLDADLDDDTIRHFERLAGDRAFIVNNQHSPGQFELTTFEHSSDAIAELYKLLSRSKKGYCFSAAQKPTSRFGTATIEANMRSHFPDKKIGRIDSETLHDPHSEAYKHRHDLQNWIDSLDVVIVSTSISTGISFDCYQPDFVFGFNSGTIAPNEFLQALWRVRALCQRFVYSEKSSANRIGNGSQSSSQIKAGSKLVSKVVQMFDLFDYLQDDDKQGDIFFDSWCEMAARRNRVSANLRETFLSLVSRQGHKIQLAPESDKTTRRRISQEWLNGRAKTALLWANRVIEGKNLSAQEVERLAESELKTEVERDALSKHKCLRRYGQVTPDLLLGDRKGLYGRLQLAYYLSLPIESTVLADKRAIANLTESGKRKAFSVDVNRIAMSPKIKLLKRTRIDEMMAYLRSHDNIKASDPIVSEIADLICSAKNLYADIFGIQIRDTEYNPSSGLKQRSPIYIVNQVLARIGYKLNRTQRVQVGNTRQWHYKLTFFGCDQIYRFDGDEKIPLINVRAIESLITDVFSYWDCHNEIVEKSDRHIAA